MQWARSRSLFVPLILHWSDNIEIITSSSGYRVLRRTLRIAEDRNQVDKVPERKDLRRIVGCIGYAYPWEQKALGKTWHLSSSIWKEVSVEDSAVLFRMVSEVWTQSHGLQRTGSQKYITQKQICGIGINVLILKAVQHQNRLPLLVVDCPLLLVFKKKLAIL